MSLFVISIKVSVQLEQIQRNILWGGARIIEKTHILNWFIAYSNKKYGGLDIRNLSTLNKTFFGKCSWRFLNHRESLWKNVNSTKIQGRNRGWCSKGVRDDHGLGACKVIRNGWQSFMSRSHFIIGHGRLAKFWRDR